MSESWNETNNQQASSERPNQDQNRSEEHYSFPVISIHADDLKGPVPLASGLFG